MSLAAHLKDIIQKEGPIDVGRFMALALGHPEFGYYMTRDPFGRGGDFTTAPEISQMFGEMIGAWVADVWTQMGRPDFVLLECGPGRGTLMADMMRATKNVPGFHEACSVHLMEISPVLKDKQAGVLADYKPMWHAGLESVPKDKPLIMIANEFLDALPVRQFVRDGGAWHERMVDFKDGTFVFVPEQGEIMEQSPACVDFIKDVSAHLQKTGGAALFIDYGYTSGTGESLQAVKNHKYVPVLEDVGNADLTAHVDFAALKEVAGVKVLGPVEQGAFLRKLGIEARAEMLAQKAAPEQKVQLQNALQRLCDSGQMGSLFKVMGLVHGETIHPAGF